MGDKVIFNGYKTWRQDVKTCTLFRFTQQHGSSCGQCIKVCPWNKPQGWTHDTVRWLAMHAPFLDKPIVKMDDIFGYGKQNPQNKWWFDIEEVDGVMKIPKSKQQ